MHRTPFRFAPAVCSIASLLVANPDASAQTTLRDPSGSTTSEFGIAVAISGTTAVVGAPLADKPPATMGQPAIQDAGAAYVFEQVGTSWVLAATLDAFDAADFDNFGWSVAIAGDTIVVGSRNDDHGSLISAGSAYVFYRQGGAWTPQAKLQASDAAKDDEFGFSVSVDGDIAVVGAWHGDSPQQPDSGAAYVFERTGPAWMQTAKLTASDPQFLAEFGDAVCVSGNLVAVGSPWNDHLGGVDAGAAYLYAKTGATWSPCAKLVASDAAGGDGFGRSVGISGGTLAVGSYVDNHGTVDDAGSVYVFVQGASPCAWTEQAKVTASDDVAHDEFGISLGVAGDLLVVGAYLADPQGIPEAGAAYVYRRCGTTWIEQAKLVAPSPTPGDLFGFAVALADSTAVIGAPAWSQLAPAQNNGSAYIYSIPPSCGPASVTGYGVGCPGPLGVPFLSLSAPPAQGSTVTLSVTNAYAAPASAIALLGFGAASLPIPGTGCSLLVASPLVFDLGAIPAGGSFARALVVPCESQLCGLEVYLQVFELAPAGFGLAATPGVKAILGT